MLWRKKKDNVAPRAGPPRLFSSLEEVVEYVEDELSRVVPKGWSCRRAELMKSCWVIEKQDIKEGEWPHKDYALFVSADFWFFTITYGNKDIGPRYRVNCPQNARVIDVMAAREFGLGAILQDVFRDCEPNEWGYT